MQIDSKKTLYHQKQTGFTLVEIVIVIAIIGILASIAYPRYQDYQDSMRVKIAVQDIKLMAPIIKQYVLDNNELPDSLADIGMSNKLDPWGTPCVFYNIEKNGIGRARKDKNLVPLNSDYDLYSKGKNKLSRIPISQRDSKDDVLRANDGGFVDLAANY